MQLASYLFFKDNAAQAFDFYARCLDGRITRKVTVGDMPGAGNVPEQARHMIAHVRLEVGDATLMGSDWCNPDAGPYPGIHGHRISLAVDDPAEAERLFASLAEGGNVEMPIAETPWALRFGMLSDRYGAKWMVSCERPD